MVTVARSAADQAEVPTAASIGIYVADFACPAIKLIVEVDGPSHDTEDQKRWDERRTEYFQREGWRVMRVTNENVFSAFGEVEAQLIAAVAS